MSHTILVCDDDIDIVGAIAILLEHEGYNVIRAYNGLEALELLRKHEDIHLVLLDVMMPKKDGLSALLELRKKSNVPVIFLSAKSQDTDKVLGLNFGADDYIGKPYNPIELIARVKSHIRRYSSLGSMTISESEIQTDGLVLNCDEKWVEVDGERVNLTATEYQILEFLMKNMSKVYSMDEIYENVWKEEAFSANNTVAVHIRRIREKIEIDPKKPRYLKVVWGIGYKIEKY